jgi:hypothetical protein
MLARQDRLGELVFMLNRNLNIDLRLYQQALDLLRQSAASHESTLRAWRSLYFARAQLRSFVLSFQ